MAEEKWVTVKIGGYPRRCPESKIPKIKTQLEQMREEYLAKGAKENWVDSALYFEIVKEGA